MAKRKAKDSVFLDLFQNKSYLLKLYRTLHPEDTTATEDSLTDVTITNVLTDNLYNDLGFIVNNKLLILVEAQSTWTVNILVRILLYLAQSYHEYFQRTCQDYYKSRKVKMPKPELYVIFTGNKGRKPDKISLSKEFFESADIDIEVKAKVIYESDTDDIINQYIIFCKVFNEQTKQHGMTQKAVTETIRICKDRNVLREYLAQRYHEYFERTSQSLYKSKKVKMPKPELYVIFTGNKGRKPDTISLSKEFFNGEDIDIEIKAKVIYESDKDNIINEYIVFCKVFNEQIKEHGMTKQAVTETIRICKDRNILKQYLSSKEVEVVTIMMSLFEDEQIMKSFIKSERHDAERAMAEQLIRKGKMTLEEIADCVSTLSFDELKEIEAEIMQLA